MLPEHTWSNKFRNLKLLAGVGSFTTFEQRVSLLSSETDKGNAFEVFAEAYIATQVTQQAIEVWPHMSLSRQQLKDLNLPPNDKGVDGVYHDKIGRTFCYQVKFRTGRPSLTWRDLSTFFGLSDQAKHKLVFTNCESISKTAEERSGATFIRGSDLDELTREEIGKIDSWIAGEVKIRKPKNPYDYQVEAVSDIVKGLSENTRGTVLMACGSGKTLIALWAVEQLKPNRVLVLCPSLALVRQILHEWSKETRIANFSYICVCSDKTVAETDGLVVLPSELDFPVTLDPKDVQRFLKSDDNLTKFVFSTYQSSQVIANATKGLPEFDVAIFDEAHKTAGRTGGKFATALDDSKIKIRKRIFFTATPRHFDISKRDKYGEAKKVFSMDDPDTYGPILHRLSFSKAVSMVPPVITGYKIVISVVTKNDVDREAIRSGIVLLEGDSVRAKQVAHQLALKAAVEKYGVSKIFSFHSTVKSAEAFTGSGSESIATHIPEFKCLHVNGKMRTVERSRLLRDFAKSDRAILSNARCLTEGVDVPAVDMVAFLSPKKSVVDIVQATGRAMRKSDGKKVGYILIPVLLERTKNETLEDSVRNTDFEDVWNVLNQLQEHDDLLEQTIRNLRIEDGKSNSFDSSTFNEKIDILANQIDLDALKNAIAIECVRAVGESWFERYGQLVAYKDEHGHCDVPARQSQPKGFGTWVVNQRELAKKNTLDEHKIRLLNKQGFVWDPHASNWNKRYQELIEYKSRFGNCRVPQTWKESLKLAKWVGGQRVSHGRKILLQSRIDLLEKIGFEWILPTMKWEDRIQELIDYKEKYGDTRVPAKWKENPQLGHWVAQQRYHYRKGDLPNEKTSALEGIGLEWNIHEENASSTRIQIIEYLEEFYKKYNNIDIPSAHPQYSKTSIWIRSQKRKYKEGSLDSETKTILERFEIDWTLRADQEINIWREKCASIRSCLEKNEFLTHTESDWLRKQISKLNNGKLSENQAETINEIVQLRETARASKRKSLKKVADWELYFPELQRAFSEHGGYVHAISSGVSPEFKYWLSSLRKIHARGYLDIGQKEQLESIGFCWNTHDEKWLLQFEELKIQIDPSTLKLKIFQLNKSLTIWFRTQIKLHRENKLPEHRSELLEGITFDSNQYENQWKDMYSDLVAYKFQHGDCDLPQNWPENESLARWVSTQRKLNKRNSLLSHRKSILIEIGFKWDVRSEKKETQWNSMYEKIAEFYKQNGHSQVSQNTDHRLSYWLKNQKKAQEKGTLSELQIQALEEVGFNSNSASDANRRLEWNKNFSELLNWKAKHGSCNVKQLKESDRPDLVRWIQYQYKKIDLNNLPEDQATLLDALSIEFPKSVDDIWLEQYLELLDYKKDHADCLVPDDWDKNPELAVWVRSQRQRKQNGSLKEERKDLLNEINFPWSLGGSNSEISSEWIARFEELKSYYMENGASEMNRTTPEGRALGEWLSHQRTDRNKERIDPEKEKMLEGIGVKWNPISDRWNEMLGKLIKFKEQHGHTRVPQGTELGAWVHNQRQDKRVSRPIMATRAPLLDDIGFEWGIKEPTPPWDEMFERLAKYRLKSGNCNVPQKYVEDGLPLGRWVNRRRLDFKHARLSEEQIQRLNSIDFVWNTKSNTNI